MLYEGDGTNRWPIARGLGAQVDNPSSSAATRALLKWEPVHAGWLADLGERHYLTPSEERA